MPPSPTRVSPRVSVISLFLRYFYRCPSNKFLPDSARPCTTFNPIGFAIFTTRGPIFRRPGRGALAGSDVPPHVADKILNHQSGTISGVAAVYQRHDFLAGRKLALERWGQYIESLVGERLPDEVTAA